MTPRDAVAALPPGTAPEPLALRPMAREHYSLQALADLSRRLWDARNLHDVAEALVLSLMGQVGTPQAAVWIDNPDQPGDPVMLRCHGIPRPLAAGLAAAVWRLVEERGAGDEHPLTPEELRAAIGDPALRLAGEARVALFAPLATGGEPRGLLALGYPPDRWDYAPLELEAIESSLLIAGVALRAVRLHGQVAESRRILQRSHDDLAELDRMKSEFMSEVAGELRTPLTALLGALESCSASRAEPEGSRHALLAAMEGARSLSTHVERVLRFSSARHDRPAVRLGEHDLAAFVRAYAAERRPGLSSRLRELKLVGAGEPRRARFDAIRLTHVLDELLDHAVRISPAGATVHLRMSDIASEGRTWRALSIQDEGMGAPDRHPETLFQAFRPHHGLSKASGAGSGLAAAQELVEAMGGRLSATSLEHVGTCFTVTLPLPGEARP